MRTIKQMMDAYKTNGTDDSIEAAVSAAFWAGQEEMRGRIVRGLEERRKNYQHGRYHHQERKALNEMMRDGLLGGQGRDDSAEFLGFDFSF